MGGFKEAMFRENIKRRRDVLGMNQTELARRMKAAGYAFHQQTIQRIEAGERPVRLDEAYSIAEILESTVESMTRVYTTGFAEVVYSIERFRRESGTVESELSEVFDDWQDAFDEMYAAFADTVPLPGTEVDRRTLVASAWMLKGLWAFESLNALMVNLHGIANEEPGDWRGRALTHDVPEALSWLEDDTFK